MTQYIYPQNLKATANLWLWSLRDFVILAVAALLSVLALVQELLGIKTFTKYGLTTTKGELLFYLVSPTNISVLSHTNIEIKIRHLMMVLSALPDIEIVCTDSSECFDDNKAYLPNASKPRKPAGSKSSSKRTSISSTTFRRKWRRRGSFSLWHA